MAKATVDQTNDGYVSFVTSSDEGYIPAGHGDITGLVVHPEADAVNLWGLAESRLASLEKMLAMFASATLSEGAFSMADSADGVLPRIQEVLSLTSTGNATASLTRVADFEMRNSLR